MAERCARLSCNGSNRRIIDAWTGDAMMGGKHVSSRLAKIMGEKMLLGKDLKSMDRWSYCSGLAAPCTARRVVDDEKRVGAAEEAQVDNVCDGDVELMASVDNENVEFATRVSGMDERYGLG
jgi:hypothetical protein